MEEMWGHIGIESRVNCPSIQHSSPLPNLYNRCTSQSRVLFGTFSFRGGACLEPSILNPRTLGVQVLNNHILTQNLHYSYCYPKPKYQMIRYLDPLGYCCRTPSLCQKCCCLSQLQLAAGPRINGLNSKGARRE